LIFIDEIDAVAQTRTGTEGNTEAMNTLNQLLVEMDGFETDQQVVVIGSTNLKEVLDPAILRPGRFDRIIDIGYPSLEEREEIFKVYLEKVKLDHSENRTLEFYMQKLATLTPGFTGADISNIVNEVLLSIKIPEEQILIYRLLSLQSEKTYPKLLKRVLKKQSIRLSVGSNVGR
jgi:AFG3 family protein